MEEVVLVQLEMEQTESRDMESKTGSHVRKCTPAKPLILEEKDRTTGIPTAKGLEERIETGLSWPLVKIRTVRDITVVISSIRTNLKIDVAMMNRRGRHGHPSSHKYI